MKKLLLLTTLMLITLACNKEDIPSAIKRASYDESIEHSTKINIYSRENFTQEEFCDMIGESFDDYLQAYLFTDCNVVVKKMVSSIFDENADAVDKVVAKEESCFSCVAREKWGVKVYKFTYNTVSYTDESITLSAVLCVPVLNDGSKHTLSAMTLGHPHMPEDKEFCPTINGNILMSRVAFNHAVVVPDYQGRGITSSSPYSSLHTHAHAVQAIDAAIAARKILDDEGFGLTDDFSLYNIGVSEGGESSYESHKIIENDLPVSAREKLNLKLSFCANGIAQHAKYIDSRIKSYTYNEPTHVKEMGFYANAFEYLSEEEKQGHTSEEFYSLDILIDNKIDTKAPVVTLLEDAVNKNDITENWNPRHSITIAASRDDDDVLFSEHAQYMYDLLKETPNGNPNRMVKLLPFNTPVASLISSIIGSDYMPSHVAADMCCFVHAVRFEDPGSEKVQIGFPDEWYNNIKELK